jgi:hypothetical protein
MMGSIVTFRHVSDSARTTEGLKASERATRAMGRLQAILADKGV